jgi:hypothetical protein
LLNVASGIFLFSAGTTLGGYLRDTIPLTKRNPFRDLDESNGDPKNPLALGYVKAILALAGPVAAVIKAYFDHLDKVK